MQNFLICLFFLTFSSQTCAADDNYNFLVRRDSLLASSSPKFPILGKPIDLSNSLGERFFPALKRYPNLSSCLVDQNDSEVWDLNKFPWLEINSPEAMRLCVFYVANALGDADKTVAWFESQAFGVWQYRDVVVVPQDTDGMSNNRVVRATYKHLEKDRSTTMLGQIVRSFKLSFREWILFDHSGEISILYSSSTQIASLKISGLAGP